MSPKPWMSKVGAGGGGGAFTGMSAAVAPDPNDATPTTSAVASADTYPFVSMENSPRAPELPRCFPPWLSVTPAGEARLPWQQHYLLLWKANVPGPDDEHRGWNRNRRRLRNSLRKRCARAARGVTSVS